MFADTCSSNAGIARGDSSPQCEASEHSHAEDHLPGGKKYRGLFGCISRSNPRENKTVAQWLHEWEQKWDAMTSKAGNYG